MCASLFLTVIGVVALLDIIEQFIPVRDSGVIPAVLHIRSPVHYQVIRICVWNVPPRRLKKKQHEYSLKLER